MTLDYALMWQIAEKLIIAGAGALAARMFERRARVVVFYGHVGEFRLEDKGNPGQWTGVHTHSIVIRNNGKLAAHNVRVPHNPTPQGLMPPNISVDRDASFREQALPSGGNEIVFDTLVPRQQVTISYLYFPPLTFNLINGAVRSDEGMARVINVLPTAQYPRWVQTLSFVLLAIGAIATIYLVVEVAKFLIARW